MVSFRGKEGPVAVYWAMSRGGGNAPGRLGAGRTARSAFCCVRSGALMASLTRKEDVFALWGSGSSSAPPTAPEMETTSRVQPSGRAPCGADSPAATLQGRCSMPVKRPGGLS